MTNEQMADYSLIIKADSGYESTTEGRCSAGQYGQAIAALHGVVPQRKPLTDEQIDAIADKFTVHTGEMWEPELCIEFNDSCKSVHSFARAIEAAHGIKE